jgi:uncharacterized protein
MSLQPLPEINADTAAFWQGGEQGILNIHRCRPCRTWFHPPSPVCPACLTTDVGPEGSSGRATVLGFTINVQPWAPDMEVPYVLGVVAVDGCAGVQLTTRFVDVQPQDMHIGLAVQATFQQVEDVWLPLFAPVSVEVAK